MLIYVCAAERHKTLIIVKQILPVSLEVKFNDMSVKHNCCNVATILCGKIVSNSRYRILNIMCEHSLKKRLSRCLEIFVIRNI